jgi:hypothetical protein
LAETVNDWKLYEAGRSYNNRLDPNYYETVDANIDFFSGNQWRNLPDVDLPKPVINIIKRVITFFVASMTTSKVKLHYEPLMMADNTPPAEILAADVANAVTDTLFDKFKIEYKVRDALFDGAITGDYCAHFYFDIDKRPYLAMEGVKGEICMELLDGSNVMMGNANNPKVDVQSYIIISGREMVETLKEEAKAYSQDTDAIVSDTDYQYQAGDASRIEVEGDESGKALYIIVYKKDKQTGTIKASKCVQNAYIYKDIDTGLSHYPIAWGNWEKQKNQYHGRALCTGMLPNQIAINRMFSMVIYHLMMTAFPKAVYNADYIATFDNAIGSAIGISGLGPEANIRNIAGYLEPGNMSNQIAQMIEMLMQYTKETLGISDAALGQIDPKNTSAIIAVQKSSAIPMENVKAGLYEWIEDIGRILFDMIGTYYGLRPLVLEQEGQKVQQMFDFAVFKDMWLDVKAEVGESSYWSEIAAIQTLDNLLSNQHLDIIQYLERIPDEYVPQKDKLISEVKERMAQQQAIQAAGDPMNLVSQLSPEEQQAFMNAPPEVKQQILAQVGGGPQMK